MYELFGGFEAELVIKGYLQNTDVDLSLYIAQEENLKTGRRKLGGVGR